MFKRWSLKEANINKIQVTGGSQFIGWYNSIERALRC